MEAVQWKAGDKFVLTTTSWKDEMVNQNEVLTVASVTNNGLTVNTVEALQFNHYGRCEGEAAQQLLQIEWSHF